MAPAAVLPSKLTAFSHSIFKVQESLSSSFHKAHRLRAASLGRMYAAEDGVGSNPATLNMQAAAGSGSLRPGSDSPLTDLDMSLFDADDSDPSANTSARSLARALNECSEAPDNGEAGDEESNNNDSNDDDDGAAELWTCDDAIERLRVEFWEHHPSCEPEEAPHSGDNVSTGSDHPQFHLYARIHGLINEYYDEVDRNGESNMIGRTKDQVKKALEAFHASGYGVNGKYWAKLLPDQAEVMLPRFIDPCGDMDGVIAGSLAAMGCGWMLSINSKGRRNDSVTVRDDGNAAASVASQDPSITQRVETLEGHFVLLRDQAVAKVKKLDEKLEELDDLTRNHQADLEDLKSVVRSIAKKRPFEPSDAGSPTANYTKFFGEKKKSRFA